MKGKILAGLVTALFYSGAAVAQDVAKDPLQGDIQQQSPDNLGGTNLQNGQRDETPLLPPEQVSPPPDAHMQGIGGSGPVAPPPAAAQGQTLYCTPVQGTGGAGLQEPAPLPPPPVHEQSSLQRDFDQGAVGGSGYDVKESERWREPEKQTKDQGQRKGDMRGLTLLIGGGVEGYTGGLAPEVRPGAAVGVTAALKPSKVVGLELGYSGAVNNLREDAGGSGPDIIRNGGQAALTLGLTASPVQPYLLGGIGLNRYNVRNGETLGFRSDTNANVPVGAGLRTHIGDFTADARVNYNFLVNNDFSPTVENDTWTGRYTGTINLGGTF
ncbi:outer membrane protein [Melittangium boletus]|uniref:Outer membrane protein beta-barrel domain-containing protein n=1 Tax=Melittangium boletus DSM 14713 TaxID=1294270 RepID=A0A250ID90_9BACT|nr:hypothetical protein [Melittangium boletus]ATB29132.1 hypothetical protein MEBOL_002581 [Melittangium boletus DSM 14713]